MLAQLGLDRLVVLLGVGAVQRLQVEHVHEQAAALDVREELVAQPGARAGALDQPGDVRDHELAVVALERAEHRLDRGERVVRHLRLRAREPGEQRRLPGVRQAHEAGVRLQAQLQLERPLLAGQAALREARGLAGGGGELPVAAPAAAAARHNRAIARVQQLPAVAALDVLDDRAGRHADLERVGRRAVAVGALAVPAALRLEVGAAPEAGQVAQRGVHHDRDVAAAAAVAAVRTALRHVRLAPEGNDAVPAGASLHVDARPVVEHVLQVLLGLPDRPRAGQPADQLGVVRDEPAPRAAA